MTNSTDIPDTRGRPRNQDLGILTDNIAKAYMTNHLPYEHTSNEPKKLAKRLRMSTSFLEMQEEIGVRIRVLVHADKLVCCLRKA